MQKMIAYKSQVLFIFCLLIVAVTFAQRIEIDRLDREFRKSYKSREAYELSQKLIRIDSSYYVGHYYEGAYRYFRASDKFGYKRAIVPLKKALSLLKKDFKNKLKRTTNINSYIDKWEYQRRYCFLVDLLQRSYRNIDQPDNAFELIVELKNKKYPYNFGVNTYSNISWIFHRNRMYTKDKYAFLHNSIEENVNAASLYADSILITYKKNKWFIRKYFPYADYNTSDYYHYKAIIYSYQLKIDSSEYCSEQLMELNSLSTNNYGNLQFIQANFEKAEEYFEKARVDDAYRDKDVKEFDYMQSATSIFKNDLSNAVNNIENAISMLGTTPGFGWNNIALSRAYYYAGNLEASKKHIEKADNFKELFINTTWGESHYDRNVLLFKYLYDQQKINELQFKNKYYWLNISSLGKIIYHYFKKEYTHLILTNELSANPERFLVLYNIFATENNMFFDEIWEIIKPFNPPYFIKLFKQKAAEDPRSKIKKYYNYYIAKLYLEDGDENQAIVYFKKVLKDESLDDIYEKLLIARVYEGLSLAYSELEKHKEADDYLYEFYDTYPELVPFSEIEMQFKLQVANKQLTKHQEEIIDDLKDCSIDWLEIGGLKDCPIVSIEFKDNNGELEIHYSVSGEREINGIVTVTNDESTGQILAYLLFNISNEEQSNPEEESDSEEEKTPA